MFMSPSSPRPEKPMTFEDNDVGRIFTIEYKFVYCFNSSVILNTSIADNKDTRICTFLIGHFSLFINGTKAIPVDAVFLKYTDLIVKTISELSQFGVHRLLICL